jgi:hypothetical protein
VPILLVRYMHSRFVIEADSIAVENQKHRPASTTAVTMPPPNGAMYPAVDIETPAIDFPIWRRMRIFDWIVSFSPSFLTLDDDTEQELRNADLLPNPQAYPDAYRARLALSVAAGRTGLEPQLIDVVNMMRSLSALGRPVHT